MDLKDNWTVVQASKLIASYKVFPNLWDCSHKYYKSKDLRKSCLRKIAKELSDVKPGCTINDVRAKLKTLRSQYGKEKRRRDFIVAKRGIDEFEPKLWCYENIKFIDDDMRAEDYNSQDEEMEDATADNAVLDELLERGSSEEETQTTRRRKRRFACWTKEQTLKLLHLLKQNPLIYDQTHPLYANNFHRTRAFRNMHAKLQESKPDLTIDDMRTKLKTLRSQYLKEKRMVRAFTDRHRGKAKYKPKLWCFHYLKFLDEKGKFLEEERGDCADSSHEFEVGEQPDDCYVLENENEIYVKSYDDSDDDEKPARMRPVENGHISRSVLHQKCLSLVEHLTKEMKKEQTADHNEIEEPRTPQALLGRMVEAELSEVSQVIFEETKWKIIRLLEEASRKDRDNKFGQHMNGY